MKKSIIVLSATCALLAYSCNTAGEADKSASAPAGMHALNLSSFGKPFEIFVPDTTASKLEITEQGSGALEIRVGRNFGISIQESPADLQLKKQDIQSDEVNRFKSFIVEEPEGLVWQSEITQPEFHFVRNSKVGETEYSFNDIPADETVSYSKEAIEKMYNSSSNLIPLRAGDGR